MLGNGWYNSVSKEVWGFDTAPWRNHPALRLQLVITYADGTSEVVATDPSWKATTGAVTFSNLRQGEYYDARLEKLGWSEAATDDSHWQLVRRVAGPLGKLRPQVLPPVKVVKTFSPVATQAMPDGTVVYDFGQNMAGFAGLKVSGARGARVQLRYAERVHASGAIDQSDINTLLADSMFQVDRYTLRGNGDETWAPRFVYHGFRYVEVSFEGPRPQQLELMAHALSTSFENNSRFSCSDEMTNKIQQSTLWSFRSNFIGFPTDCPQREKNGWTGDAQLACETGLSNFNTATSYQKWLADLRDEQQPDGSLPGIVPTSGWGYYWGNGPAWDIACIVVPWSVYQYTGDAQVLRENYAMMKKYVDYMHTRSPHYIADFGLGDWIPVETETPVGVTSTGYFYYSANVMANVAGILGEQADARTYDALAGQIKTAFNQKYFHPKSMTYANGSQTALSCALFHGLVEEKHRAAVVKNLVAAVRARDNHIDCGILGARYVPQVLKDNGHAALAYELITTKTYPGWGYWITQGATTLWEDWKGKSSLNHIMLGDVSSWFYKVLAGIRPDATAPGFRQFEIYPEFVKGLTHASGTHESPYGTITSAWRIENGQLTHAIEVPVNTTAVYYLPVAKLAGVRESGQPVTASLYKTGKQNGRATLLLPSGKYSFTMPLPAAP